MAFARCADPVKTKRQQVSAPRRVHQRRLRACDAVLPQHLQGQMFQMQQIVPALAERCAARRGELDDDRQAIDPGNELGLFASRRRARRQRVRSALGQAIESNSVIACERVVGSGLQVGRPQRKRARRVRQVVRGHVQRLQQAPVFGVRREVRPQAGELPAEKSLGLQWRQPPGQRRICKPLLLPRPADVHPVAMEHRERPERPIDKVKYIVE